MHKAILSKSDAERGRYMKIFHYSSIYEERDCALILVDNGRLNESLSFRSLLISFSPHSPPAPSSTVALATSALEMNGYIIMQHASDRQTFRLHSVCTTSPAISATATMVKKTATMMISPADSLTWPNMPKVAGGVGEGYIAAVGSPIVALCTPRPENQEMA